MKIKKSLFTYFEKAGKKEIYHPHDIIYMQEDNATTLYLIIKGRVRVYVMNENGEEVTLEILDQGRIFGESSFLKNSYRPTTVSALEKVELISCELDSLYPYLTESKELTIAPLQLMSTTCDYLSSMIKKAYTYDRYQKVASFLLEQESSSLHFTHEDIAGMIGLSRVTVSKVLNEFAKKHYITLGYRCIHIINKKELSTIIKMGM